MKTSQWAQVEAIKVGVLAEEETGTKARRLGDTWRTREGGSAGSEKPGY
jgi:hypothetical protein